MARLIGQTYGHGETRQKGWIQEVQNRRTRRGYWSLSAQAGRQAASQDHGDRSDPRGSPRYQSGEEIASRRSLWCMPQRRGDLDRVPGDRLRAAQAPQQTPGLVDY